MKKKIRFIGRLVLGALVLLAFSCNNMLDTIKSPEPSNSSMARLGISLGATGRLVSPEVLDFEKDKDLSFVLSRKLGDEADFATIKEWTSTEATSAYKSMTTDQSVLVPLGNWSFKLEAFKKDALVATASKTLEVKPGENALNFGSMSYNSEGEGKFSLSISWLQEEKTTRVVAGLYTRDTEPLLVDGTEQTFQKPTEGDFVNIQYNVMVPSGSYRFKAQLYQGDVLIGVYTELVQVAGNLTSKAEREIESLKSLSTITLNWGEGGALVSGTTFKESYNSYEKVTLPTKDAITAKTGYIFAGWYKEGDEQKTIVTQLDTITEDAAYCAYWQLAPVTFSPENGTKFYYGEKVTVSLSSTTEGASIKYKLGDGEWQDYSGEIEVTSDTTITAKAIKDGLKPSEETSASYTVRELTSITPPARTVYSVGDTFDSTGMEVTAEYDDGETREVNTWTTDFDKITSEKGLNKTVTVSYTEGEKSVTAEFTVDVASYKFTETVKEADSSYTGTMSGGTYKKFGDWPQTIMDGDVTVGSETLVRGGFTYHVGSDGNYYVKHNTSYYKVEPIVWRVLTNNYLVPSEDGTKIESGNALLLAEKILIGGIPYYVDSSNRTIGSATVYANNYKYSTIRAWLNGLDVVKSDSENDSTYKDKGFLQTAFTPDAQKNIIAETTVDNSAASTTDAGQKLTQATKYACDDTKDKIFLLSEQEATTKEYGFGEYSASGQGNTRIRVTTDYAEATRAYQDGTTGYGGRWWLRSPPYNSGNSVRYIIVDGHAEYFSNVGNSNGGVVPALSISLQ